MSRDFLLGVATGLFIAAIISTVEYTVTTDNSKKLSIQNVNTGKSVLNTMQISSNNKVSETKAITDTKTIPVSPKKQLSNGASQIPNIVGISKKDAESVLISKKIHYEFYYQPSSLPKDIVIKQDEVPGQSNKVTFYVSTGSN